LFQALGDGSESHREIVNSHCQQHPGILPAKFAPVQTAFTRIAGELSVDARLSLEEALLDAEATGIAIRVGPMRATQKFAKHKVPEPIAGVVPFDFAELHRLNAAHDRHGFAVDFERVEKSFGAVRNLVGLLQIQWKEAERPL